MSDPIQERLDAMAPEAARLVLSDYVGGAENDEAASLIRRSVSKLPKSGRIRKKNERLLVKGLALLLQELPTDAAEYKELAPAVSDLCERAGWT
jgi:hypothetical protein